MRLNESIFKKSFSYLFRFAFLISVLGIVLFVVDFGFDQSSEVQTYLNAFYFFIVVVGIFTTIVRYLTQRKTYKPKVLVFDAFSIAFTVFVLVAHFFGEEASRHISFLYNDTWVKVAIILTFIREFFELNINFKRTYLNPAQLFILSFFGIILLGSFLLMLPKATYDGLSFVDALFTATSAVCVTGLIVVDTATYFTIFGQTIIIVLIQIGGLGILTFASYFSYFFKGGTTYETQLTLTDMTGSNKIGEVFSTLKRVIFITFMIEFFAAILIYFSLDPKLFESFYERIYFSIFHSVSAFCNAGFSTLSNNLYESGYSTNYFLHLILIGCFVLGGLGFPIVVNLFNYVKYFIAKKMFFLTRKEQSSRPWVLNLNSRITLITTSILFVGGALLFYINEYDNTLAGLSGFGKVVTALFGGATPRTAGFNTVDMSALHFSTIMMIFLLMWIGASPASTGGGIKTNTFAIATLNFLSLAKGKSRIEVYRREVADISVRRAFAVISLSLMVIGFAIIGISYFDSEMSLLSIAFECFSAYSTVGLSIGLTAQLTSMSKLILVAVMFVGRVSMLTVMIAFVKKMKQKNYRYPVEEITIN
ncbi:TrkH family potassium uptake protein [Nonlabens antarcticus]|uniref:TrkH family potassium uptake protein n=1 Tax=Nonlabens antarcticus TaxID=392714 RepID=UPI001891643C|nr:potassium transporter TrkG [Nonlabens antarcticus]